jgi:hypothetical protein
VSTAPPPARPKRLAFLPAILLLVLAWFVMTWPWLSGAVTIPWDSKLHFQAQLQFLASSLAEGDSPFWNPFAYAGWPQIADPQSLIFSPYLPLALLGPDPSFRAADAVTLAMLLIAGLAILAFVRDRGFGSASGLLAGIIVVFGGMASARLQHVGQLVSYAAFCLTLWTLGRCIARPSYRWGILAGLSAVLMALKPDQVAFIGAITLAIFVLHELIARRRRGTRLRRALGPLTVGALTGLAAISIPILMTIELLATSSRPAVPFETVVRGSLDPVFLLTALVPDLFGSLGRAVDYVGPGSPLWPARSALNRELGQLYIGAIPMMLLLVQGVGAGRLLDRPIRFFTALFLFLLLYAVGSWTPFFHAVYDHVPGVDLFRRPADATFLMVVFAAIIVSYCAWTLLREGITTRAALIGGGVVAVAFALAALVALQIGPHALWATGIAALVAIAALLAIFFAVQVARHSSWAAVLLLAGGTAVDLAWFNGPNEMNAAPPPAYDVLRTDTADPLARFLKQKAGEGAYADRRDRVEIIGLGGPWQSAAMVHGLENLQAYNPLRIGDYERATGVGQNANDVAQRGFTPLFPSYRSKLADLLGLRWIAVGAPIEQFDQRLKEGELPLVATIGDAKIYENPNALPRAMFVPDYRIADFDRLIADGDWGEFDPRTTVLLDREPPKEVASGSGAPAATSAVTIRIYRNTEVVIDVDAPTRGFLVLNDAWHPWWKAEVDGSPAPILRANVLFRAVAIGPGRHRVRFTFRPMAGLVESLRQRFGG